MAYCKKCGTKLDGDADFCSRCGAKIQKEAAGKVTKQGFQLRSIKPKMAMYLALIVVLFLVILFAIQSQQNASFLQELYAPKTLNLNQNDVQITSVDNWQSLTLACSSPTTYGADWWLNGRVNVGGFQGGFANNQYSSLFFDIVGATITVDGSAPYILSGNNEVGPTLDHFSFDLNREYHIYPTSSHTLNLCLKLENSNYHITTNQVCTTYQIPKLC
jgi:predicted nucleic acid-binding Zn ribbon protein